MSGFLLTHFSLFQTSNNLHAERPTAAPTRSVPHARHGDGGAGLPADGPRRLVAAVHAGQKHGPSHIQVTGHSAGVIR